MDLNRRDLLTTAGALAVSAAAAPGAHAQAQAAAIPAPPERAEEAGGHAGG